MRRTLKAGFSLFRIRTAEGLEYRLAALSGATVSAFWAFIEIVVIMVFFTYGSQTSYSINNMTLQQGIAYIWMTQSLFGLLAMGIDDDIMTKIVNGDVSVELCRPLDLYWHWYARSAAGAVSATLLRGGFVFLCGVIVSLIGFPNIGVAPPVSLLNFTLFLLSAFGAVLLTVAFRMLLSAIRLSVAWGDGPMNLLMVSGGVLSGAYLPLQLWPDFMQTFLRFQPFASTLDTPVRLYVGSISIADGLISIAIQLVWIIIIITTGKLIMNGRLKSIVVQGG
jgi:ABC-2 type transport system permease protein